MEGKATNGSKRDGHRGLETGQGSVFGEEEESLSMEATSRLVLGERKSSILTVSPPSVLRETGRLPRLT